MLENFLHMGHLTGGFILLDLGSIPRAEKGFKYGSKGLHSENSLEHLALPTSMSLVIAEPLSSCRNVEHLMNRWEST